MNPDIKFVKMQYFEVDERPARAWTIDYEGKTVGILINQAVGSQAENSFHAMIDKFGDDRDGMHDLGSGQGDWFTEATELVQELLKRE